MAVFFSCSSQVFSCNLPDLFFDFIVSILSSIEVVWTLNKAMHVTTWLFCMNQIKQILKRKESRFNFWWFVNLMKTLVILGKGKKHWYWHQELSGCRSTCVVPLIWKKTNSFFFLVILIYIFWCNFDTFFGDAILTLVKSIMKSQITNGNVVLK